MNLEPKRYKTPFTKAWWSNAWYYYKWHIVGVVAAILAIGLFLVECATTVKPDFTITYMGGIDAMGQIEAYELEDKFATITKDIDNDEKNTAKFNVIYLDKETSNEAGVAMFDMANVEMAGGNAVVLLFDKEFVDRYSKYGFCDLGEYAKEFSIDESLLKRYDDGSVYAINMGQNPIFTQFENVDADDLYLCVRPLRGNEKAKWQKANHENGLAMARYIISGGNVNPY